MTSKQLDREIHEQVTLGQFAELIRSRRDLFIDIAGLAVYLAAQFNPAVPSSAWIAITYLLLAPGDLLRRTFGVAVRTVSERLVIGLATSIAVAAGASVLIQLYSLLIGVAKPFDSQATGLGTVLIVVTLICTAQRDGASPAGPVFPHAPSWLLVGLLPPLVTVAGVGWLDNGRGPGLLLLGFGVAGISALCLFRSSYRDAGSVLLVYTTSLSILWSFTLRTPYLYGYDVNQEYNTYVNTLENGYWQPISGDAYNAMLSLTAMPAIWTDVSGLDGLTLFKFVYPAIFAVFPVVVLMLVRQFSGLAAAAVAVVLLTWNPAGLWQVSGVARQEVALVCFAVLMYLLVSRSRFGRPGLVLMFVLGTTCVLTHYTTSYITIALLLSAGILDRLARFIPPRAERSADRSRAGRTPIPLSLPIVLLVIAVVWIMGVNGATQNVSMAAKATAATAGLDQRGGLIETWLDGNTIHKVPVQKLFATGQDESTRRPWLQPYPAGVQAEFPVVELPEGSPPGVAQPWKSVGELAFTLVRQVSLALILLGAGLMLVTRWRPRPSFSKHISAEAAQLAELVVAACAIAAVMRVNTALSLAYNSERLLTQLSIILGVPFACALMFLMSWARRRVARMSVYAGVIGVGLAASVDATGTRGLLFGNDAGNLQNESEYFQRYSIEDVDVAAADWIGERFVSSNQLYTDKYGALLFLGKPQFSDGLLNTVIPSLLDQRGYVLGTSENVVNGRARSQLYISYAVYEFPTEFLDKYKARVYTNGSAIVWN